MVAKRLLLLLFAFLVLHEIGLAQGQNSDNALTNNNRFKGPDPWRDMPAYMPAGGCSSTTPVNGADTTGTISSGSTTLTLGAARDFKNGCGIAVLGAGPTSTLAGPTLSSSPTSSSRSGNTVTMVFNGQVLPVTGTFLTLGLNMGVVVSRCSVSAYNGTFAVPQIGFNGGNSSIQYNVSTSSKDSAASCLATFIFGHIHGVGGSTTYNYKVAKCDLNEGCSPASANFQITGATATLSKNNYNWIGYPFDPKAALYLLYSDKGLGGALTCVNASVTVAMIDIGGYNPCPPWAPTNPPASATAQTLFTTISSGAGTTTLTLANAASNSASNQNVYHDESSFLNSCINDANNDMNVNSTKLGGGYGCYIPYGVYGMNGPLDTATLSPNANLNIYVAGTLNFQTQPWMILHPGYHIIGVGNGAQGGTVGMRKPMTAIQFGGNVPYGWVFGSNSFTSTLKGFGTGYTNGTGVFIGTTSSLGSVSSVTIEDVAITEQGSSGNAPCVTIDNGVIGNWLTNVSCQANQAVGGMPCVYITHTAFASSVNQILYNDDVNCEFHAWKIDGPGGNGTQAAIHDIEWRRSFGENLPNADFGEIQLDNGDANGGAGWALQGISLDHVLMSDSTLTGTFVQMAQTSRGFNMPISAVEIKNSYLAGVAASCAVITNCQQFALNNVSSLGVGVTNFPAGQNGIVTGTSVGVAGVLTGQSLGIVPGQANFGQNPAIDMPFVIYMTPPNPNNISSTGSGSLTAGVYCNSFTGFDVNNLETGATNVRCQTVGASSDIVYDFDSGTIAMYSNYNFYYCFVASGTCSPNQKFSSISTSSDGGSGRLYTFSTTSGSSSATPPVQGAAMLSWIGLDPTNPPYSCLLCVAGSSDAWPLGIGLNSASIKAMPVNKGINILTQKGMKVGKSRFSALSTCSSGLEGAFQTVTDSTTNTWGATITGGGTNHVLAYCDGATWTVMAK